MNFYILKKIKDGKTFSHPWTNDDESFFDGHYYHGIEDFLEREDYFEYYKWVEIDSSRIQRNGLDTIIMSVDDQSRLETDNYFLKCVSDNELPLYYYNVDVTEPSNQNNDVISYALVLNLDNWSTFGSIYNEAAWTFPLDVLFGRKHANRFNFEEENIYFDYLKQPYLARGDFKPYQLIHEESEEGITLNEWKYINSDAPSKNIDLYTWLTESYWPWMFNSWASAIYAGYTEDKKNPYPLDTSKGIGKKVTVQKDDFWQNYNAYTFDYIPDFEYNSNGLYRWLVLKTGKYLIDYDPQGLAKKSNSLLDATQWNLVRDLKTGDILLDLSKISQDELKFGNFYISYVDEDKKHGRYKYTERTFECVSTLSYDIPGYLKENFLFNAPVILTNIPQIEIPVKVKGDNGKSYWVQLRFKGTAFRKRKTPWFDFNKAFDTNPKILESNKEININREIRDQWGIEMVGINGAEDISMDERYCKGGTRLTCKLDSTQNKIEFKLHLMFSTAIYNEAHPEDSLVIQPNNIEIQYKNNITISPQIICKSNSGAIDLTANYPLNADTLVLIPILKSTPGIIYDESGTMPSYKTISSTIYSLFNSCDLIPGSNLMIGSLINEIPLEILALASRKNKTNEDRYSYSGLNLTSCEKAKLDKKDLPNCPEDIQLLITTTGTKQDGVITANRYNVLPCLFTDLSYIPVTLARSPVLDSGYSLGGNNFINTYYDLLTNSELIGINSLYSDPVMYSPEIYQWKYLIDGINEIVINGFYLNFKNMVTDSWEINLNTSMSNATYFKVDLGNLKNEYYPFSKAYSELSAHDSRKFTQYTEDYYNWLQNNQNTFDAAKIGFEINAKRAREEAIFGGLGSGAAAGAQIGGNFSSPIGIISGIAIGGIAGLGLGAIGANEAKNYNKQLFDLEWNTRFKNMASRPLSLIESGFSSGSINYASWARSSMESFNLFRTYCLSLLDRKGLWFDFCWNGYYYNSTSKFKDYDNRHNFNFFSIEISKVESLFIKHLKNEVSKKSLLFSQSKFMNWFISKLSKGIRLFKCDFDLSLLDEEYESQKIVLENIENDYIPPNFKIKKDSIILSRIREENPKLYSLIKK